MVIIGQDPYHNEGQAHGLCFSVKPGVDVPPSLVNIYKELKDDLGCYIPNNGYLVKWAKQGVLMLNTVLTVRAHMANSHRGKGWEEFTDAAIRALNKQDRPIVYIFLMSGFFLASIEYFKISHEMIFCFDTLASLIALFNASVSF